MTIEDGVTGEAWSRAEVEATVSTYFRMLRMQELGQKFIKSEIIRRLETLMPARTYGSIEYKFRNISAVLHHAGIQAVSGYKPLPNVQRLLVDVVGESLRNDTALDEAAIRSVETAAEPPMAPDFSDFVVPVPKPTSRVSERTMETIGSIAVRRDYLERESRNRSLGNAGELLVMEYEARRLSEAGAKHLSDRIEHVSRTRGDGIGYDIMSYDANGKERFIEVKTTAYDAETPFFISPNEVSFSSERAEQFHLYRLFSFRKKPQMFTLPGAVAANCLLDPANYRATLLGR